MTAALDQLLAAGAPQDDGTTAYPLTPDWMQGRTAYGGISAALALHDAMRQFPGDAPLRTAQISFVGPVGGDAHVSSRLLRASKSSRFVQSDVVSESGFGTAATFTFSNARDSHIDHDSVAMPTIADPEDLQPVPDHPMRPAFTRHFDMRPYDGPGFGHGKDDAYLLTWVRWVDAPDADAHVALLALADALPPAAIRLFYQFGPISSSTWITHFLVDHPTTRDGWWLLESKSDHVRRGFSVQKMTLWNRNGDIIALGEQGVALYA